jgi:membrane dipeptidase
MPADALEIIRTTFVWDNVWPVDLPGEYSFGNDWDKLSRFAAAGVNAIGMTLAGDNQDSAGALRLVAWARAQLRQRHDQVLLIQQFEDLQRAQQQKKLAVVFQFEGTRCFDRNLDLLETFYALGVKQVQLAFNNANCVGGGCAEPSDGGLTVYGKRFVQEAQRIGVLIDLSHVGKRTSLDAFAHATQPMVISHSNAYALHPSFRNVDDEQARACAATGGLVGVSGSSEYLGDPLCRTETLFQHLDHYVQLLGADHVGLGLDIVFDAAAVSNWARSRPDEWPMTRDPQWPGFRYALPEQLAGVVELMLKRGYPLAAIQAILGGNYRRICRQVWV